MIPSSQQFIVDTQGKRIGVVIAVEEYERLKEMAAEAESLRGFSSQAPDDSSAIFDRPPDRNDELAALGFRSFP